MVDQTMSSMDNLVLSSEKSFQATEKGIESVKTVETSIESLQKVNSEMKLEVDQNNQKINAINDIIKSIAQKTQVINDIVFQTKLLSFNASVEAARAGEQGKGFAVVAEEVGNLAQMSGNAAKEISDILASGAAEVSQITLDSKKSFDAIIDKSQSCIEASVESTSSCYAVMNAIADEVKQSKEKIIQLQIAASEQTLGIKNIKSAMQDLQQSTNEVSSLSDSSAQLGIDMGSNYTTLKTAISVLDSVILGSRHQALIKK
jgi:methyl-accepting chemotaxis protein